MPRIDGRGPRRLLVALGSLAIMAGCGSSGGGGGGSATGGAGGVGTGGTGASVAGTLSVTVTSASVTKTLEYAGEDVLCLYSTTSGEPSLGIYGQNHPTESFLAGFEGISLLPHQRTDTYDDALGAKNRLVMTIDVDAHSYWWFNDFTAGIPSTCNTNFAVLDASTAAGSATCKDLVPRQSSADFSGDIGSPGPHAQATLSFQCSIKGAQGIGGGGGAGGTGTGGAGGAGATGGTGGSGGVGGQTGCGVEMNTQPCQTCMDANCCNEQASCKAGSWCQKYFECFSQYCQSAADPGPCVQQYCSAYMSGEADAVALSNCFVSYCEAACQ